MKRLRFLLLVIADWIDDGIFQHRWTWFCHRVAESPLWDEYGQSRHAWIDALPTEVRINIWSQFLWMQNDKRNVIGEKHVFPGWSASIDIPLALEGEYSIAQIYICGADGDTLDECIANLKESWDAVTSTWRTEYADEIARLHQRAALWKEANEQL